MSQLQQPHSETIGQVAAIARWDDEGGASKPFSASAGSETEATVGAARMLTSLVIDESEHNRDGLLLHSWDRADAVTVAAFVSRKVIDDWVHEQDAPATRKSLFRSEYTALGRLNLAAIERIVAAKYQRSRAFNQPHPFVDVLLADIVSSGEVLDLGGLSALVPPPTRF